jgi:uncharacterized protein
MVPRFAADRMIGRLARMLRLLGYDTFYSPSINPAQLAETARCEDRIILTRGDAHKRFQTAARIFTVQSEYPPEQLREVVQQFSLDPCAMLWTRCAVCNGSIVKVPKKEIQSLLHPKVNELYNEFFRCAGCGRVYWRGSHVERIVKNLAAVLNRNE